MDYSTIWVGVCIVFSFSFLRVNGAQERWNMFLNVHYWTVQLFGHVNKEVFFFSFFFLLKGHKRAEYVWMDCSTIWMSVQEKKILQNNVLMNYQTIRMGLGFRGGGGSGWGKKIISFSRWSWVLGGDNPFLFEGGGGKGCVGFIFALFATFVLFVSFFFVTFSNSWRGKEGMGFFFFLISSFFYSWRGKGGMGFTFSLFVSFFNSWRWKGGMGFFFFFFFYFTLEWGRRPWVYLFIIQFLLIFCYFFL